MKVTLFVSLLFSLSAYSAELKQFETKDMLCVFYSPLTLSWEGATTSCTSKASIKKNELEIKVLELQKQKLEGELSSKIKK